MKLPFKTDKRFEICKKEMLIAFGFQIIYTVIINAILFLVAGKPLSEYKFILGMPSWFFACIVVLASFIVILGILCFKILKNISVDAYINEDDEMKKRGDEI